MQMNEIATSTDPKALEVQARVLGTSAKEFQVVDLATFQSAGQMLVTLAAYKKQVHAVLDPIVEAAHKAHKVGTEQRRNLLAPAEEAEGVLKGRMAAYEQEQERLRLAAEEERRREQERLEAEERARVEAEEKRLREEAQEKILAEAIELEEQGDTEAAAFILEEPTFVPPVAPQPVFAPPVQVVKPVAQGVSFRDNWVAEVVDFKALVKAVAEGKAPLNYLAADLPSLNRVAKALKGNMQVPGVRVENKRTTAVRA